jgi:transposase
MSRVNPYASIEKRTFQAALIHLLETDYRVLGSQRVLRVLAEDVEQLAEEFYLTPDRARSGHLVWTCTGDDGQKAQPGKPTEAYKTVTVVLPLIDQAELKERTERCGRGQGLARTHDRQKRQVQRIVTSAAEQGGLLTIAEVSLILGIGYEAVRGYLKELEEKTGQPLPLKGYKMDQGSRPSHKGEIIRWSERGLEPPDIAHETGHNLKSVERYLKDYERVRMLLKQGLSVEEISAIIGRGKSVVKEYVAQAQVYHPELFKTRSEES